MKTHSSINPTKLRTALALAIALTFSAVFSMSYFHEGSSISKYLCKKMEIERVKDAEIEAYSDSILFGDARVQVSEDVDLSETADSEQGFQNAERIREIDKVIILVLLILSWLMLVPRLNNIRHLAWIYLVFALYLATLALCKSINGGAKFSELAIPAHSMRWLTCVALWIWFYFQSKEKSRLHSAVTWILLLATSLTFYTHGYEAFNEHPKFRDLLYGGLEVFSIPLNETVCTVLLKLIGAMDICLAIAILFCHQCWPKLLLWMTIWGGITALSRPIAFGEVGWEDALLRIANCAVPFIIYLLIKTQHHSSTTQRKAS